MKKPIPTITFSFDNKDKWRIPLIGIVMSLILEFSLIPREMVLLFLLSMGMLYSYLFAIKKFFAYTMIITLYAVMAGVMSIIGTNNLNLIVFIISFNILYVMVVFASCELAKSSHDL